MGGVLVVVFALSLVITLKNRRPRLLHNPDSNSESWLLLLIFTLSMPVLGVFLGQLFRGEFSWSNYDSPARFAICIPIIIALIRSKSSINRLINISAPMAIVFTLASVLFIPNDNQYMWGQERITTYFVDPLTFGSLSLMLGILALISINQFGRDTWKIKGLKILTFLMAIYLSVKSGSRTGWISLPIVGFLWIGIFPKKHKYMFSALGFIFIIVISGMLFQFSTVVQQRVTLALSELAEYQWNGLNPVSSIGDRISFIRIAFFLFLQNPLGGWGDSGFQSLLDAPQLSEFALPATRNFVLTAGFHNEVMTNMVRSGIWGLLSSVTLFLAPMAFFVSRITSSSVLIRRMAFYGLCFMTCVFVNGMSTEVFNLKFTASFYALMIACLSGAIFSTEQLHAESGAYEKN